MITLKSRREIDEMKAAGKILADTHKELKKIIKPGITSWDLEVFTEEFLRKNGATQNKKALKVMNMLFVQVLMTKFVMASRANKSLTKAILLQ